jgi:hypothetical protein
VPPKKKGKTVPADGLKANWVQRAPPVQLTEKLYGRKSSRSSSTLSRVASTETLADSRLAADEIIQYGGISDGDDEHERQAAQVKVKAKPVRFDMAGARAKVWTAFC